MKISRRDALAWLGTAAASCSSGGLAAVAVAGQRQVTAIPFAYSLYGMRAVPLGRALRACAAIGYSGVELACMTGWPCDPDVLSADDRRQLRLQFDAVSLQLPCLMENLRLLVPAEQHRQNLERLKAVTQLAQDLRGNGLPPVIETVLGGRPDEWDRVKDSMVEALRDWERVAAGSRVVIAIKAHVSNALHRPEEVMWLLRQVDSPWIKAAYDYSHFQRQGIPLRQSLGMMLPQTVFIHIKDNITNADGKTEFALPGDGDTNYGDYLKQLTDAGYTGTVCVEVSSQVFNKPDFNPIVAAERCYMNLRTAFEQAGLRARA
jgi:sugar phosphate isomerase/epimerase